MTSWRRIIDAYYLAEHSVMLLCCFQRLQHFRECLQLPLVHGPWAVEVAIVRSGGSEGDKFSVPFSHFNRFWFVVGKIAKIHCRDILIGIQMKGYILVVWWAIIVTRFDFPGPLCVFHVRSPFNPLFFSSAFSVFVLRRGKINPRPPHSRHASSVVLGSRPLPLHSSHLGHAIP